MDAKSSYIIISLAIALVVLIIILSSLKSLKNNTDSLIIDQDCWNSVAIHTNLVKLSQNEITPDLKCPTHIKTIPKKMDEEKANKIIADSWATCWANFHKGQAELFNTSGTYCHTCSIIKFEDRQQLNNLYTYMRTHDVPATNTPYLAYLAPFSTKNTDFIEELPKDLDDQRKKQLGDQISIDNQNFAVIFFYVKGEDEIKDFLLNKRDDLTVTGGILAVLGTSSFVYGSSAFVAGLSAAATGGASLSWTPVGWVILGATAVTAGGYLIYQVWTAGERPQWITFTAFMPYNQETLESLGCEYAPADTTFNNQQNN